MNVIVRLLSTLGLAAAAFAAPAQVHAPEASPATEPALALRVMFIGNSLTYTNNLPRMVAAVAASQPGGPVIRTATYAIPGAELDDLWDDGHAAEALRGGEWDVVVLQELGGLLSCVRRSERDPVCRRSAAAHRAFVELAQDRGARVLLLETWQRPRGIDWGGPAELRQRKEISADTYQRFARWIARDGATIRIVPAAGALFDFAAGRPIAQVLSDGAHPSIASSTIMAAQLYAAITGRQAEPQDLMLDFPMLPAAADVRADTPMETQPQLAGDGSRFLVKAALLAPMYAIANGAPTLP